MDIIDELDKMKDDMKDMQNEVNVLWNRLDEIVWLIEDKIDEEEK